MAIVKKLNDTGGSAEGYYFHSFSGMPNDQYAPPFDDDPRNHIGETFVIEVRAELTSVTTDEIKSGKREKLGFKVIDSKVGKMVARSDGSGANQVSIDEVDDDSDESEGDYGDYGDEVDIPAQGYDDPFAVPVPDTDVDDTDDGDGAA